MPNRNLMGSEQYRYAFQGQEKDPETGKEAFQLRLWDGRIGRWLTTDPYSEFHSPYMGMGNNPISVIDPDGGCTTCPDDAKIGDTFSHSEYGNLTFTDTGWASPEFGNILDDVMISGQGSGLSGIAGVRFEQWKQIEPEFIRSRNEFGKGAFGIAIGLPTAVIGGLSGGLAAASYLHTNISAALAASNASTPTANVILNGTRIVARAPKNGMMHLGKWVEGGRFLKGTGAIASEASYWQYYGLSATGTATAFTPILSESYSYLPVIARGLIAGGASIGIIYANYQKHTNGNNNLDKVNNSKKSQDLQFNESN